MAHPQGPYKAVKAAVLHINQLLMSHPKTSNLCHQLELKTIFEAHQMLLRHEPDGNFLSGRESATFSFQIQFQTTPGDGLFEALLKMKRCIVKHAPFMRPFGLCK